ncbi:MAG: hypothetical protein ACTHQE_07305, partial [Thermomicrobiales bacterium]
NPRPTAIIGAVGAMGGLSRAVAVDGVLGYLDAPTRTQREARPNSAETPAERAARLAEIDQILHEIHASITDADRAFDDDAWLYDDNGLPH